jgi:hypothetical protein
MEYTKLGRTGLAVSRICLGCMSYGECNQGNHAWSLGEEESPSTVKACFMRAAEARLAYLRAYGAPGGSIEPLSSTQTVKPATTAASPDRGIGPGFDCTKATQPLARMICGSTELAKIDLRFNQAFYALWQQLDQPGRRQLYGGGPRVSGFGPAIVRHSRDGSASRWLAGLRRRAIRSEAIRVAVSTARAPRPRWAKNPLGYSGSAGYPPFARMPLNSYGLMPGRGAISGCSSAPPPVKFSVRHPDIVTRPVNRFSFQTIRIEGLC